MEPTGFNKLLTKNIPHIYEKILLSLDYASFKNCHGVCKAWDEVLTSESVCKKLYSLYGPVMDRELFSYAAVGNFEKMESLLFKGVNPNGNEETGNYPLLLSASKGQKRVVKLLLNHGADPDKAGKYGITALMVAVTGGNNDDVFKMGVK